MALMVSMELTALMVRKEMSEKMKQLGIDTKFHLIEDAGHFAAVFNQKAFGAGFDFLEKHLQVKQGTVQNPQDK